jgi:hypothetical protein
MTTENVQKELLTSFSNSKTFSSSFFVPKHSFLGYNKLTEAHFSNKHMSFIQLLYFSQQKSIFYIKNI